MTRTASQYRLETDRPLSRTLRMWGAFAALLFAFGAVAKGIGHAQPTKQKSKPKPRQATVIEISGKKHTGVLAAIDSNSVTLLQSGRRVKSAFADVLRIDLCSFRKRRAAGFDFVMLANGDRLRFTPTEMDGEDLVGIRDGKPTRIPLISVRGVMFRIPEATGERDSIERILNAHREKFDLLILRNGDRLSGVIKSLDRDSITMSKGGKSPLTGIRALAFNHRYIDFPKSNGRRMLVNLTDGSRVTATKLSTKAGGRLTITAAYGGSFDVATSSIVSLRVLGGKAVSLSDLKPSKYEFTPFLGGRWEFQRDRNVKRGRLMVRGREYGKGIGMHSQSRLTYDLAGKYRSFYAIVGIDDAAAGKGSVRVAVEVDDGKRVFHSSEITGKSKPLSLVPIDVSGKQRLTLIVEFGQFGDVLDLVDWCDAVLIKK